MAHDFMTGRYEKEEFFKIMFWAIEGTRNVTTEMFRELKKSQDSNLAKGDDFPQ